jgi:hypothetical protein
MVEVRVDAGRSLEEAARAKQEVRERVWDLLERERVARFPGAKGRVPNFAGAPAAAERLASLPAWRAARVGKGGGYSDLEFGLLVETGLIGADAVLATTVHPLQVLDEELPETPHDFRLDLIVAGEEVITCRRRRRPPGILWDHLDAARIAAIPALAERRERGS